LNRASLADLRIELVCIELSKLDLTADLDDLIGGNMKELSGSLGVAAHEAEQVFAPDGHVAGAI
jgi:hypothetical protein